MWGMTPSNMEWSLFIVTSDGYRSRSPLSVHYEWITQGSSALSIMQGSVWVLVPEPSWAILALYACKKWGGQHT